MAGRRLGILGGTFDPIHNGHIGLAEAVYRQLELEQVLFIPAYLAPHKLGLQCAPAQDRYRMAQLAIAGRPYFTVADLEIRRSGISYTLDTVLELERQYPQHELYFISGADALPQLHTWHCVEELLRHVIFVAAGRPGYGSGLLEEACRRLGPQAAQRLLLLTTPEYAVSSTEIRQRVQQGVSLDGLVPPAVEQYIRGQHLYLNEGALKC